LKDVFVQLSYVEGLKTGLPVSYLEFWFAKQDVIDAEASQAFDGPRPDNVDPDYDYVEIRGYWADGDCDYIAVARLAADDVVELVAIEFDIGPVRIDP
jgi:hypothetical protein